MIVVTASAHWRANSNWGSFMLNLHHADRIQHSNWTGLEGNQKNEYYLNEYYWLQGEIGITKAQNEKHKPSLVIKHIHQIIFFFVFWGWGVWGWGESYQLNSKWFWYLSDSITLMASELSPSSNVPSPAHKNSLARKT